MKRMDLKAYAKINLAIDVLGKLPSGYHEVAMIMQKIELHDKICVKWIPKQNDSPAFAQFVQCADSEEPGIEIEINSNKRFLPRDRRNLTYRAAELMIDKFDIIKRFGDGTVRIDIKKQIPVGAGLGGGSTDCAAVIHALSKIWSLELNTAKLCEIGATLGSDVPFCITARPGRSAALAEGSGTKLTPIRGVDMWLVLSKPPISVSTEEVYKGFGALEDKNFERPNIKELIQGMEEKKSELIVKNIINVLENVTLKRYASAMYTKNKITTETAPVKAVMSGSGATIIGFYNDKQSAEEAYDKLSTLNKETYLTKTLI